MSSQPQHYDTSASHGHRTPCPPEPPSRPLEIMEEQLGSTRDDDTIRAASQSLHDVQLDQTASSNNYEHEPQEQDQDQERFDEWTVEDILNIQQQNYQAFIQEIRATNAEHRRLSRKLMRQDMSTNFNQGFQRIMSFFTNWTKQFTQHRLVAKVAALEEQLKFAGRQNQQLGDEYKEMRARHNNVCTKLDKALRERDEQRRLVDGGTLANSSKVTDDVITDLWTILAYNIRTLAHSLAKSLPSEPVDAVAKARLSWISQLYLEHLQDEEYRELVLQGYLWSMVNDTVFDAGIRIWGGPGLADLKTIQDNLVDRLSLQDAQERREICQHAARWLAQGSGILNQLWGCEPAGVMALANMETGRLMTFLSVQETGTEGASRVRDQISAIVQCAVELDQMLMCSKALFQVHWKDQCQDSSKPQLFNPNTMDALCSENDLSSESAVEMVISPFLSKAGNADGQNYECSMVLAKATVVCD
ncbi:hypothetical protein N0V84_010809 [Fusarium piperis]|uniref:Uncharacterized protein n=1 Tax=Fusarium piperis TaxID=1435070 RepID=A0A9W8TFK0_9HYPO|nr:hypothetical protein N0V84_010809 [Fusarium piperis]